MPRVICAGHVNWDVTIQVEGLPEPDGEAAIVTQEQSGGGSASNVAGVLASLDVEPTLFGSVGGNNHGFLAERALREAGVDCSHLRTADGRETSVKYLIVDADGEVMVLGNDGANEAFGPEDVDEAAVRDAEFVHLTSQRPATAERVAEVATDAGVPVSFDPGRRLAERDFRRTAELSDLLFLNDREADAARERGLPEAMENPTIVRKHGSGGATIVRESSEVSHPGYAVDPVDTTGAGDAFAAGYIAARLEGRDDEGTLAVANACGALAARVTGAHTQVGWRDIQALLDIGPEE
jgi:ribokinase